MSRSIHITRKNFNGLTKEQLDKQLDDSDSELREWIRKSELKKEVKKKRKNNEE